MRRCTRQSGYPALSSREDGRSNSNRQPLVRGIFTPAQRHDGISHPTVAEFSLALLTKYKNVSHLPTGCVENFDSDLCFIAIHVGSNDRRRDIMEHWGIRRALHNLRKLF